MKLQTELSCSLSLRWRCATDISNRKKKRRQPRKKRAVLTAQHDPLPRARHSFIAPFSLKPWVWQSLQPPSLTTYRLGLGRLAELPERRSASPVPIRLTNVLLPWQKVPPMFVLRKN